MTKLNTSVLKKKIGEWFRSIRYQSPEELEKHYKGHRFDGVWAKRYYPTLYDGSGWKRLGKCTVATAIEKEYIEDQFDPWEEYWFEGETRDWHPRDDAMIERASGVFNNPNNIVRIFAESEQTNYEIVVITNADDTEVLLMYLRQD